MKTTLVIQDGLNQVVLTPENEHEKNILNLINKKEIETTFKTGNFRECQGGWIRQYKFYGDEYDPSKIDSLMIILKEKQKD
jgi:hypothetical protein